MKADIRTVYNGPNVGLGGSYFLGLNTFARRPNENSVTQDGSFDIDVNRWFQKLFKRSEITINEDFTFTPDLKDYYFNEVRGEIGTLSSYGVRTRRSDAFRNAFGINVLLPVTTRVNLSTSYSSHLTVYSNPEFRDNMTNTVGIRGSYIFPKDTVYSTISLSSIRVEKEDTNSYSLLIGTRHSFSPLTVFEVNAGVSVLDYEINGNDSTFRGGARLTKRSRLHTYNTGYSRTLNTISGVSGRPTVADLYYINITNTHSKSLTSNIGANYAVNRALSAEDVETHSYNLSGSLNYMIREWLRCSFTVSHFKQESDKPTVEDIQRNLVTLALVGTWD